MNQTSLVGRPLYQMAKSLAKYVEKRSQWYGPVMSSSSEMGTFFSMNSPSSTGVQVNDSTAYTYSVFWACVNNISTDIGSFPLNLYKADSDGGKTLLRDHKLYPLLHDAPNPEMTAFTFRGVLTSHALTYGMGYAEVVRDGAGRPQSLWPITPSRVAIRRNMSGDLFYEVARPDGTGMDILRSDQMFVLPGSTYDGVYGRNIINMARDSIGLGLAAERFGGEFFGNGSTFGGVFEHPTTMTPLAYKNFKESVNSQHQGVANAHKYFVVEEGMKYQKLGVDPNNAQFLETRQHQIEEMCRWFRMPPHKVQHLIRTSYNSVEQMNIEYSSDTLQPWCVRWEQELLRQLIAPSERRIQFFRHNMNSKLRGDTATRYAAYTQGIQNGFMSQDDVRELEDWNPIPNGAGKNYFIQSNNQPLDRVDEIVDAQVAPPPAPVVKEPAAEPEKKDDDKERMDEVVATIRAEMAQMDTRIATAMEQVNLSVAKRDEDSAVDTAAWRDELDKAREERGKLQALLIEAVEHADQLAAAKEAARLEAEERAAALQRDTEAAQAERDAVKVAAELEQARLEAEAVLLRTQIDGVTTEREAFRETYETTAEQAGALAAKLEAATKERDAVRAQAETEASRLQTEAALLAAQVAEVTAERDASNVIIETVTHKSTALWDALEAARTDKDAVKAQADADAERFRVDAERLSLDLAEAAARAEQLAADRDAVRAAALEAEQGRLTLQSDLVTAVQDQAAKAKADADAASQLLAEEAARLKAEQDAHAATKAALETVSMAVTAASTAADAAKLAATQALDEAKVVRAEAAKAVADYEARLVAEVAARLVAEQAIMATRKAEAAGKQVLVNLHSEAVERILGRLMAKEVTRARSNKLTPKKLVAWGEAYYLLAEDNWVDELREQMAIHLAFIGSSEDVETYTRNLVRPHLTAAMEQIRAVAGGDPDDYPVAIEKLITKWEQDRPAAIARVVLQEGMTYVRSL